MKQSRYVNRIIDNDVCIIIPAFNEDESISGVIRTIRRISHKYHIIVINDCSTDSTYEVVKRLGVPCITLPINLGIGGAVQTGLRYARDQGYAFAVQVDGDGQHDPREIKKLLRYALNYDLIIGSRYVRQTNYKGSLIRRFGNAIFSFLIVVVCGKKIFDTTSGFRVYTRRAIDYFSRNYPTDFPEPESLVYLLKNGYNVKEVRVQMRKRTLGHSSIDKIKALYLMFSISIGIIISGVRIQKKIYE